MDLFDVGKACLRRWYVFLPLVAVAVWFSYSAYNAARPVYYGAAVIGFSSPSLRVDSVPTGEPVLRNGLMDFGGAPLVANMTALALTQPAVIEQVAGAGGSPGYVSRILDVEGSIQQLPLVQLEVTDPNPVRVERTLQLLIDQSAVMLRTLQQQAGVPDDRMVSSIIVSPPSAPTAGMPSRTRSTIAYLAAGVAVAVVMSALTDSVLGRMQARRRRDRTGVAPPGAPTEQGTPSSAPAVAEQPTDALATRTPS